MYNDIIDKLKFSLSIVLEFTFNHRGLFCSPYNITLSILIMDYFSNFFEGQRIVLKAQKSLKILFQWQILLNMHVLP